MKLKVKVSRSGRKEFKGLATLLQEKALRSTAYAGVRPVYDEVLRNTPKYDGPPIQGVTPGQLRDAIYHAHSRERSSAERQTYHCSVNKKKAPHWYLVEYGHWRVNKLVQGADGKWRATTERLATPEWVPAHSYLRRSFDAMAQHAVAAMRDRFTERVRELQAQSSKGAQDV